MGEKSLEEVLLVDAEGCVVEGCRSNLFVVDAAGELVAPNLSRGAVAGLAQELVHEGIPEVVVRDMKSRVLLSRLLEPEALDCVGHAVHVVFSDFGKSSAELARCPRHDGAFASPG